MARKNSLDNLMRKRKPPVDRATGGVRAPERKIGPYTGAAERLTREDQIREKQIQRQRRSSPVARTAGRRWS